MVKEPKVKRPVDFEFVKGKGIHPFYLNMTLDQVLDVAIGWKIASIERDAGTVSQHINFDKVGKKIVVCALDVRASLPNAKSHYQVYWVSTYDAIVSDGRQVASMTRKKALQAVLEVFELSPLYIEDGADINDSCVSYSTPDDINAVLFSDCERHEVRVSEVPPLDEA